VENNNIHLATGGTGGTYFAYGNALKDVAKQDSNIDMSIQMSAGSAANIRLIENNIVDMAIVQNDTLTDAFNGKGEFEGNPIKKTKAVAGLYTENYQIVVNKKLQLNSVEDLKGLRVSVGEEGSGVLKNAKNILKAYGLTVNDIDVRYLSFEDAATALKNGEIDAFFVTAATPTKAISELADANVPIDILSLDDRAVRFLENSYDGCSVTTIKSGTYKGINKDITTVGVMAVLVANENVSANHIDAILNLLKVHHDSFNKISGDTLNIFDESALNSIDAPFHKAAAKWYSDNGITGVKPEIKADTSARKTLNLDMYQTVAVAVLALFIGVMLKERIKFLTTFCIPAPVVGGMIFAVIFCILYAVGIIEINFDETLRNVCMVMFFTSVGFQANMKVLKSGGKGTFIFLALLLLLIILQNTLAVGLSKAIGISPLIGMCTGSIPMIGGHGTAGAFGPLLEDMNVEGATTLATAAATFGLVTGSLMGGPLANSLIKKKNLTATAVYEDDSMLVEEEIKHRREVSMYAPAVYQLTLAMGIGTVISFILSKTGMTFPVYIGSMIVAAVMRNISEYTDKFRIHMGEINDLGSICLSLFLGVAMITLKLWQLATLALPLFILLAGQTVLMFVFARFIVFKLMGSDYDAAVLAAGTCGFGMGATPNAMANMQAVTEKYLPSVKAFLIVPIVGSMFADFLNSLTITFFINFLS
jgi:sodium/glutamate symporter